MAIFKITQFFLHGYQGWQEVIYCDKTSVQEAITAAQGLRTARTLLLAPLLQHKGIRASAVDAPGVAQKVEYYFNDATAIGDPDNPVNCAHVKLYTDDSAHVNYHLRGLPDDWIRMRPGDTRATLTFGAAAAIGTYLEYLKTQGFRVRTSQRFDLTQDAHKIKLWGEDGGFLFFDTMAELGTAKGETVVIKKATGVPPEVLRLVNTRQYVKSITADRVVLALRSTLVPGFLDLRGGTVYRSVVTAKAITKHAVVGPSTRLTGKYPLVPRARQRATTRQTG